MIDLLLQILALSNHLKVSKNIDIAKGINKTPMTIKEGWNRRKRIKAWK